jgi:hypothetical protein
MAVKAQKTQKVLPVNNEKRCVINKVFFLFLSLSQSSIKGKVFLSSPHSKIAHLCLCVRSELKQH